MIVYLSVIIFDKSVCNIEQDERLLYLYTRPVSEAGYIRGPMSLAAIDGRVVVQGQPPNHIGHSHQIDKGFFPGKLSQRGVQNHFSADV